MAPLVKSFSLNKECQNTFKSLKLDTENSVVCAVDKDELYKLETDASDIDISGVLNQNGCPVAFYSITLQGPELKHLPVEKEACALVECVTLETLINR